MPLIGTRLHYHSRFELVPVGHGTDYWVGLVRMVRSWIKSSLKNFDLQDTDDLGKRWFFEGGEWKPKSRKRFIVRTGREVGIGDLSRPEYWAVRYEHPGVDERFRQWATDIGTKITTNGIVYFSITVTHWPLPSYIGKEFKDPQPNSPKIVRNVIKDSRWDVLASDEKLAIAPIGLNIGDGRDFVEHLISPDRECPVVYLSMSPYTNDFLINDRNLMRDLAGNANVYVPNSTELNDELEYYLPPDYRCENGRVRVYMPKLSLENPWGAVRHRYFTVSQIHESGSHEVSSMIVRSLNRRPRQQSSDYISSISDVNYHGNRLRIDKIRRELKSDNQDELLELLEDEILKMEKSLDEHKDSISVLEQEKQEFEDEISRLNYEKNQIQKGYGKTPERETGLDRVFKDIIIPQNLRDVVDLVEKVFEGKIIFHENAKKTAEEYHVNNPQKALECLFSIGKYLHRLYFQEPKLSPGEISKRYLDIAGFEFAITEKSLTKVNKRMMAQRTIEYEGKNYNITPHVKYGTQEPHLLRVHFVPIPARNVLLIGHCGAHLETSGTRKARR